MRLTKEQLEEVKKDYGVDVLWSWSKISSWYTSKYEWFLHYIMHEEPDRLDCIYGKEGSYSHDIIEKYYNKEIPYEEAPIIIQKELKDLKISDGYIHVFFQY